MLMLPKADACSNNVNMLTQGAMYVNAINAKDIDLNMKPTVSNYIALCDTCVLYEICSCCVGQNFGNEGKQYRHTAAGS